MLHVWSEGHRDKVTRETLMYAVLWVSTELSTLRHDANAFQLR